ncbi:TPA: hypothetical protein ACH3X1_004293 [Trebouxia sp. C0004]
MLVALPVRFQAQAVNCFFAGRRRPGLLVIQAFALRTSPQLTSPNEVAAHLRSNPENFLDLRQAKNSDKSPDFKHKFSRQALWLNSAPQDFVQLVREWDDDAANTLSKATVMPPQEELWKSLFSEPGMWYDKRPTMNNRPNFVHKQHHFSLWLNGAPEWVVEGIAEADDLLEEKWEKARLEVNVPKRETSQETVNEADTQKKKRAEEGEDVSEKWNVQKRQQAVDSLLGSCAGGDFVQTAEPPQGGLTVDLLPHQKRALAWMMHREHATGKPAVQGGLLADDQGLGKTVTTIALLLSHPPTQEWLCRSSSSQPLLADDSAEQSLLPFQLSQQIQYGPSQSHTSAATQTQQPEDCSSSSQHNADPDVLDPSGASPTREQAVVEDGLGAVPLGGTLIVAPLSVLEAVWARELASKVAQQAPLKVAVHHGCGRNMDPESLAEYDVVITTYGTLRSEHRQSDTDGLFGLVWWRVVLDEAQNIKDQKAQRSLAVFNLKAKHKWALSGTPIQNQVQELFSYFHFLQYHPFNTQAAFRQYMRNIEDLPNPTHALERLREMLQPVMLRRTKESSFNGIKILTLPARKVTVKKLRMSKQETILYEHAKTAALQQMQERADERAREAKLGQSGPAARRFSPAAFAVLVRLRQACIHSSLLPAGLLPRTDSSPTHDEEGAIEKTAVTYAEGLKRIQAKRVQSTKQKRVLRIVKDAQKRPEGPQKVIVFSTFVQALHLMADTMAENKLGFVMLHGQMTLDERSQALDRFRGEAEVVVMLASLLACGTGITVTCASEVVLMEPYWNPFAENQAIDRVHRIGQEHDVTVHRLYMAGTVEEKIMELQERKLKMLGAIIEQPDCALKAKSSRLTAADWTALLS